MFEDKNYGVIDRAVIVDSDGKELVYGSVVLKPNTSIDLKEMFKDLGHGDFLFNGVRVTYLFTKEGDVYKAHSLSGIHPTDINCVAGNWLVRSRLFDFTDPFLTYNATGNTCYLRSMGEHVIGYSIETYTDPEMLLLV